MNQKNFFVFVSYVGAQRLGLSFEARNRLRDLWAEGVTPLSPDFFRRLPEFCEYQTQGAGFWEKGTSEISRLEERGIQFLIAEDSGFPKSLLEISKPPWVLSVMGSLKAQEGISLSVVGAREPLDGSLEWMNSHLGILLESLPVCVVSGGARGIDQMAHRLAIRYERSTWAFLPSGLLNIYPAALHEWTLPILEMGGALVSEFHPRTEMRKWHFQLRNRLIAGVSWETLVVESRVRSGTWLTAKEALHCGRSVGVVAGSAFEPKQSGNVALIASGAVCVATAHDLVMLLRGNCQEKIAKNRSLVRTSGMHH